MDKPVGVKEAAAVNIRECVHCGRKIRQKPLGRVRLYCTTRCRVQAFRDRQDMIEEITRNDLSFAE